MLLFQVMDSRYCRLLIVRGRINVSFFPYHKVIKSVVFRQSISDRFYQALYAKLLDPHLRMSSKQVRMFKQKIPQKIIVQFGSSPEHFSLFSKRKCIGDERP